MNIKPLSQKRAAIYIAILLIGLALIISGVSKDFGEFIKFYSFAATLCTFSIVGFILLLNYVTKVNLSNDTTKKVTLFRWVKYTLYFVIALQIIRLVATLTKT